MSSTLLRGNQFVFDRQTVKFSELWWTVRARISGPINLIVSLFSEITFYRIAVFFNNRELCVWWWYQWLVRNVRKIMASWLRIETSKVWTSYWQWVSYSYTNLKATTNVPNRRSKISPSLSETKTKDTPNFKPE